MRLLAVPLVSDPKALWYFNRASGLVLLVLFTAVVLLGQLSTARDLPGALPRFVSVGLHRNVSLVTMALLVMHILTATADSFVDIRVLDAIVPFVSVYRPFWLGLGAVALDLLAAVALTTAVRHRMTLRAWRGLHVLGYPAWAAAVVHGLGTGTDTRDRLTLLVTFGCVTMVVLGALVRIPTLSVPVTARVLAFGVVAVLPLLLTAWLRAGPLAPHWSKRAGTPPPPTSHAAQR